MDDQPDDYHIKSIQLAMLVEFLGGAKAADSCRMQDAVLALVDRGYTPEKLREVIDGLMS